MLRAALIMLAGFGVAGCSGDKLGPSADVYDAGGFSAYHGARSDAVPPGQLLSGDAGSRLAAHMDKQDPRWSDREWREERRAERSDEARRERYRKRRAEERRQQRAAAVEAHGGY